jgi:hypothetical protein
LLRASATLLKIGWSSRGRYVFEELSVSSFMVLKSAIQRDILELLPIKVET